MRRILTILPGLALISAVLIAGVPALAAPKDAPGGPRTMDDLLSDGFKCYQRGPDIVFCYKGGSAYECRPQGGMCVPSPNPPDPPPQTRKKPKPGVKSAPADRMSPR